MRNRNSGTLVPLVPILLFATGLATGVFAQETPYFIPGNLVVTVEGCGVHGGTCTSVPNGTGNGTGNSSAGGYGDNEAAPLTLFQYTVSGASSAMFLNSLVLPQTGSGANLPVSGEYGSSSEGTLQLDGTGRYLTIMGYGIDAPTFDNVYHPATVPGNYPTGNAATDPYGAAPSGALAQSGSLTGQYYTPVARVVALIDPYGNVNSSTALYNIFNTNNPRSIYTLDGSTSAYVSGQGTGCDSTGGVFYIPLLTTTTSPTAITGNDSAGGNNGCPNVSSSQTLAQDTRDVQIYTNPNTKASTLYISVDSTEGKSNNRSFIGTLGDPPATSLYSSGTGPTQLSTENNASPNVNVTSTGKLVLTASETNGINSTGLQINLSPVNYFFASVSVLYVADSGNPKQTSATSPLGDGGLQKWVNTKSDGSGNWKLQYTLASGLNLVENPTANPSNTSGATGLYGVAGTVSGNTVYLYATPYNISDLDPTYLYGISDTLTSTTNPGTSFTQLAAAPADSNFKGLSFAPTLPAGSATITSSPSGLAFTSTGSGCAAGTYITPVTLIWTPGKPCELSVVSPQTVSGTQYDFSQWQDGTTATTDAVTAPTTSAVFTASFKAVPVVTWPTASAITYGQTLASSTLSGGSASVAGSFAFTSPGTVPAAGTAAQSVTFTPTDAAEYETLTSTVMVAVNKAKLTVTANNLSKALKAANPTLTASYSGFVNGDTAAVLSGSPSLTTTATTLSPAGVYPITVAQGTLSAANYTFAFVNGTLSVVASPTVSLTATAVLSGSASTGYTATITVTNSGNAAASNVTLSSATLGSATGTLLPPQTLASIAAGGSGSFTVNFAGSAGADGAGVAEKYAGTYTGGTFSASIRSVTLP